MERRKNHVPGGSQAGMSLANGKHKRWPSHRRPAGLASRVWKIDCMLADIQAQIERLQREQTHLGVVRGEVAGMKATWRCT